MPASPPPLAQQLEITIDERSDRPTAVRSGVIRLCAVATIVLAGATGLLLDSDWSSLTLGLAFVALGVMVVAISRPTSA